MNWRTANNRKRDPWYVRVGRQHVRSKEHKTLIYQYRTRAAEAWAAEASAAVNEKPPAP